VKQYPNLPATRRAVLAGLAAALVPSPLVAQARPSHLGVLLGEPASDRDGQARAAALTRGLVALGVTFPTTLLATADEVIE
jgi:hypothetical protein